MHDMPLRSVRPHRFLVVAAKKAKAFADSAQGSDRVSRHNLPTTIYPGPEAVQRGNSSSRLERSNARNCSLMNVGLSFFCLGVFVARPTRYCWSSLRRS